MKKVTLVMVQIDKTILEAEKSEVQIAQYYKNKYENIKIREEAQAEFAAGFLLNRYMGISQDDEIIREGDGKPHLSSKAVCRYPHFNLSHSKNMCVLAMGECDVGIDVEKILPFHYAAAKKVFGQKKADSLYLLEEEKRNKEYTRLWTVCEAVLKLTGKGFNDGWQEDLCRDFYVKSQKIGEYYLSYATKEPVFAETIHF